MARREVAAVFARLSDLQRETAAHRLRHCQLDLLLRATRRGPVALDDFVALLNLDERAGRFVARALQRREFFARLRFPIRRGDEIWNFDRERRGVWLEHLNRQPPGDFFTETILRFKHHAIRALGQRERNFRRAIRVCCEATLDRDFAQLPIVGIR